MADITIDVNPQQSPINATPQIHQENIGVEVIENPVNWGTITGTLSDQTDLQNALDTKADDTTVVHKAGSENITGIKTFSISPLSTDQTSFENADNNNLVRKEQISEVIQDIKTSSLTFIGYVSTTEPSSSTYILNKHDLWIVGESMPTTFPVTSTDIFEWDGSSWQAVSKTYTASNFDCFRNINNNEGYYWFGGEWVVMSTDLSTTYFHLNSTSGKWEIKENVNLPGTPTTTTPTNASPNTAIATKEYVDNNSSGYNPPLFTHVWADHLLDDTSHLLANTFSWQSGLVYTEGYQHLVNDISGVTPTTETIAGTTITYYRASDKHKIVLADQETNVSTIYTATGVAWYYILDTDNTRFKLPRTKYAFTGLRDTVGNYVAESLPNITGSSNASFYLDFSTDSNSAIYGSSEATGAQLRLATGSAGSVGNTINIDASRSSSTYQNNAPVQQRATQMYLYFYVGQFTQSATEQTAGLNASLFNGKADLNLSNINPSNTAKSYFANLAMPSDTYDDLTIPVSNTQVVMPADGWIYVRGTSGYIYITNETASGIKTMNQLGSGVEGNIYLPVSKGDTVTLWYSGGTVTIFRFIYSNGSKWEKQ